MKLNRLDTLRRREFLRRASALGLAGAATPWALSLASIGEAAAATASTAAGDYKALVCVFLNGGNDYANMVVPSDDAGYKAYAAIRPALATPLQQLLPLSPAVALAGADAGRQMALSPQLPRLQSLFNAGQLGIQLNVGTLLRPTTLAQYKTGVGLPPRLFSHNDQASVWQSSGVEGTASGWGGRIGDQFLSSNGNATFSCINVSGNAVFLAGQQVMAYQMSTSGALPINGLSKPLYGSQACSDALRSLITASDRSNWLEQQHNSVCARAIKAQSLINGAMAGLPALATPFDSANNLAMQLQMVARLIAARSGLGASRQVFYVSLGGFDQHSNLLATQPALMTLLDNALAAFYAATVELGVAEQVTTFTASEFGRTMVSNGDGSDHGWGAHHFVLGGAVKGGRYWGTPPTLATNGPEDVGQGRYIPGTSVDQLAATLASWMGVSPTALPTVLPQIGNFSARDLGYFG